MKADIQPLPDNVHTFSWARLGDYLELTKPRITSLVLFTTAAGYYLGLSGTVAFAHLLHTLVGTALVAGGASAVNMWLERRSDAQMQRTLNRPLPAGRLQPREGAILAALLSVTGIAYLYLFANPIASWLAGATLLSYSIIYTPLKKKTWLCTIAGAVPGALPPTIGWAAARGELSPGAWILFAIVFLWQLPHFYSIAWIYRDDYSRAGLPMLPVIDHSGIRTGRQACFFVAALIFTTIIPSVIGMASWLYCWGAVLLGVIFLLAAIHFSQQRNSKRAKRLFLASVCYLPALLVLLMIDKAVAGR